MPQQKGWPPINSRRTSVSPLVLFSLIAQAACGGGAGDASPMGAAVGVEVSPPSAWVAPSGLVSFAAIVAGAASTTVAWSVEDAGCGSISATGVYTAPATPASCRIVASLDAYGVKSAPATVTVRTAPACATEPLRATGTTYYYCACAAGADPSCSPGSDACTASAVAAGVPGCASTSSANPGTDPRFPRLTDPQAKFKTIRAGDTVALCRGGAFNYVATFTNNGACNCGGTTCSAANSCDLRDYLPPGQPASWATDQTKRPLVNGPIFRPNNYSAYPSSKGFRFFNLANKVGSPQVGSIAGGGSSANVTDLEICNLSFSDMPLAVMMDPADARWTLRGSQLARIDGNGVLGACTDCVIDGNYFAPDSYGSADYRDHPIYVSAHALVERMRVTNNEVHGCPSPSRALGTGTPLIAVHGHTADLLIENNLIQCDHPEAIPVSSAGGPQNALGIQISSGGYAEAEQFPRTIVRRNRVIGSATGISLDLAPDALVENNVVEMMARYAGYGIELKSSGSSPAPATDRAVVRNNTVYVPAPSTSSTFTGISVRRGSSLVPTGETITNNVIFGAAPAQTRCFDLDAHTYALLSNNACNGSWSTTLDSSRIILSASPFTGLPTDFTPATGSPLVDAGTTASYAGLACGGSTWSPTDTGVARDARPDVGAFER